MAWPWLPRALSETDLSEGFAPRRLRPLALLVGAGLLLLLPPVERWTGVRSGVVALALALLVATEAFERVGGARRFPAMHASWEALLGLALSAAPAVSTGRASSPLWLLFMLCGQWAAIRHGRSRLLLAALAAVPLATGLGWQLAGLAPLSATLGPLALASFGAIAGYGFLAGLAAMLREARLGLEAQARRASLDRERRQIARELHTTLGASLTEIALWQDVAARSPAEARRTALQKAEDRALAALGELSQSVAGMQDGEVGAAALEDAVRSRLQSLCAAAQVQLEVSIAGGAAPLAAPRAYHLLKVVEESALNAVRHGRARRLSVEIALSGTARVSDDGLGFDPGTVLPGHGLRALRAHAEAIGASLELRSAPGQGTSVLLSGGAP